MDGFTIDSLNSFESRHSDSLSPSSAGSLLRKNDDLDDYAFEYKDGTFTLYSQTPQGLDLIFLRNSKQGMTGWPCYKDFLINLIEFSITFKNNLVFISLWFYIYIIH